MKKYQLSLTKDYAPHWDMVKAVKELLQNGIDSDAEFEHEFFTGEDGLTGLSIRSKGVTLPPSSLLLGASSKQDDNLSIGKYGEGYKLALLVLTRLGYPVKVINGNLIWTPSFEESEQYGTEVLTLTEQFAHTAGGEITSLNFIVYGLQASDVEAVRDSCLHMQDSYSLGNTITVPQGRILEDKPGALYVNGLHVCNVDELQFGYDVSPQYLKLDRDRQAVADFGLLWVAKDMWLATKQHDRIASLVLANCPDLKYISHSAPKEVNDACAKQFVAANPGVTLAKSPDDVDRLRAQGVADPRYFSSTLYNCVNQSSTPTRPVQIAKTPAELLHDWYESNKKYLGRLPKVGFKALLSQAEKWKA